MQREQSISMFLLKQSLAQKKKQVNLLQIQQKIFPGTN